MVQQYSLPGLHASPSATPLPLTTHKHLQLTTHTPAEVSTKTTYNKKKLSFHFHQNTKHRQYININLNSFISIFPYIPQVSPWIKTSAGKLHHSVPPECACWWTGKRVSHWGPRGKGPCRVFFVTPKWPATQHTWCNVMQSTGGVHFTMVWYILNLLQLRWPTNNHCLLY